MTPEAVLMTLRSAGGTLVLADGELRLRAPRGAVSDDLRASLRTHREALQVLLRDEQRSRRRHQVSTALEAAYDRLTADGPWTAAEISAHRQLCEAVDQAAREFMAGDVADASAFDAALKRWEAALRFGRSRSHGSQSELFKRGAA